MEGEEKKDSFTFGKKKGEVDGVDDALDRDNDQEMDKLMSSLKAINGTLEH